MKDTITVKVDITKDQIQPDSAQKLQVYVSHDEPVTEYVGTDGVKVTGDNLVITTTVSHTLADLQKQSSDIATEIAALTVEKEKIDALIPFVSDAVTNAVNLLQK